MGHLTKSPMAQNRRSAVGSADRFARGGTQLRYRALAATAWLGSRQAFRRASLERAPLSSTQSATQASGQAKTSLCRDEHRIRQTPNAPRHDDRRPCPQATTSILEERMSRIVLIAISAWVLGVFDARAQTPTPQEHQACSRDASRLCRKQMSEGDYAVQQCLQQHRERLGRACRKAFEEHGM